ncbi:MAG: nucleotide exchange factor GrpE [Candidatus Acetothermia bacterium]
MEEETKEKEYQDLEEGKSEGRNSRDEGNEAEEEELAELKEALEEKDDKIDNLKDRIRHLKADFDNYKKRQGDKTDERVEKEKGKLIMDLVPIYDNLDRAFKSFEKNGDEESFIEGIERIYAQFDEFLDRHEVELIQAEGEKFNPNEHEALMRVESKEYEDNEITEEFERGYRYKNKVLKPSKVKVNVRPTSDEGEGEDKS